MPFGVDENRWKDALRGLARGEYHLLLGAGASRDGTDKAGTQLPGAWGLRDELVHEFEIPGVLENINLSRAYEAASTRTTGKGESRHDFLLRRFADCVSPEWYHDVCQIRWSRIWTLNIDDVVEHAYARAAATAAQVATSVNWNRGFRDPDTAANELQVVHIHGLATAPESIVFDILEYFTATAKSHTWHRVFGDQFNEQPFIVVGARLVEEWDLAQVLRRGNASMQLHGRPSFVVLDRLDELDREQFQNWGLIPIEANAEEFFAELAQGVRAFEREFAATTPGPTTLVPQEAIRFLAQFDPLRIDQKRVDDPKHDFYAGHDPSWGDIREQRDAEFDVTRNLRKAVEKELIGPPTQTVRGLVGPPFSGKTTGLLRISQRLLARGHDVYLFRADNRLDVEAVFWWLQNSPPCTLAFDGLADASPDIAELAELCASAGQLLSVIGTERSRRRKVLMSMVPASMLEMGNDTTYDRLSNHDIKRLVEKLRKHRRLGQLTPLTDRQREDYFRVDSSRQLVEGMARLERGGGFMERLSQQYSALQTPEARAAYGATCLAYSFGYLTPAPIAAAVAGLSVADLVKACDSEGALSDVLEVRKGRLKPRHRRLASLIVDDVLSSDERFDLSLKLGEALAPYVTPATIGSRSLPYRIARELMDHEVLSRWIADDRIDTWYESLASSYAWNARFWEQRALAAARRNTFDKAESFARNAVRVHPDPFTWNTLGTVLMRKAIHWMPRASDAMWECYWEAVDALSESIEAADSHERTEHPYMTFFTYTFEIVFGGPPVGQKPPDERIAFEWSRWMGEANRQPVFEHPELKVTLDRFRNRWLQAVVVLSPESGRDANE